MNHVTRFVFVILAFVILSACSQNKPQPIVPKEDPVKVNLQTEQTFVNGKLSLSVAIEGDVATVELLKNGQVFKTLKSPFTFVWDTTKEKEGQHTFQARVTQEDIYISELLTITIDRTVPSIDQVTPLATAPGKMYEQIDILFSEAVESGTVNLTNISLIYKNTVITKAVTLAEDQRSLVIEPQVTEITLPATFALKIQGIKDLAGNTLEPTELSFEMIRPVDFDGSLNQDISKSVLSSVLAFDQAQSPVVLFSEGADSAPTQLYAKRWTSEGWQLLGEQINPVLSHATPLQVVIAVDNNPTVAYTEYASIDDFMNTETSQVVIKHWTGTNWQQLDKFADDSFGFNQLELKADDKHLLRVWDADVIVVKVWSGTGWTTLKTVPLEMSPVHEFAETYVYHTAIALDADNNPFIAWFEHDYTEGKQSYLYVKHWNGAAWEILGSKPVISAESVWWPEIVLSVDPNNNPILVFTEATDDESATRQIYVKRWGSDWQDLGASSLNVNKASEALLSSLEFDAASNPIVSWTEGNKAYASVLQDSSWQLLSGSSLNQNTQHEATSTVYANSQGMFFKVLNEMVSGAFQLFVQQIP